MSGRDAEGAGEVAQNVFLTAARKAPQLAGLDGLSAWFHSAAMRESANHRRSAERRRKRQEKHALRETPGFASPEIPVDARCPALDGVMDRQGPPAAAAWLNAAPPDVAWLDPALKAFSNAIAPHDAEAARVFAAQIANPLMWEESMSAIAR